MREGSSGDPFWDAAEPVMILRVEDEILDRLASCAGSPLDPVRAGRLVKLLESERVAQARVGVSRHNLIEGAA